jgi:hypothetical protein
VEVEGQVVAGDADELDVLGVGVAAADAARGLDAAADGPQELDDLLGGFLGLAELHR